MSFDLALRLCEILLAVALIQQSLEHLASRLSAERWLFLPRFLLALALLLPATAGWACLALTLHGILLLHRFDGPYNGGSDRISLLTLLCLSAAHFAPTAALQELALAYLGAQLVLSYFISGWVKVWNRDWLSGRALQDVFLFSAYPVSAQLRGFSKRPRLLAWMSWLVIGFELLFPLSLFHPVALAAFLLVAATFHLANACLFGLNRFFWAWIAAYPALLWLQTRLPG